MASTRIKKIIKIAGSGAGVIAFIITVAGALQFFKAPRVNLVPSTPLLVTYKGEQDSIEISFDLTFDNTGYGSEIIREANARVMTSAITAPANLIPFANSDIFFDERNGTPSDNAPITVPADQPKKLKLVFRHKVGGISRAVIETPGKLRLFVNLFGKKRFLNLLGENKHYALEFCFESEGRPLTALSDQPYRFYSVTCPLS